jgi:putative tryptophan/tyrosine transport system substrate-binding protein
MQRREFITLVGGAAATWPLAARAQQPALPVIGYLSGGTPETLGHLAAAFRQGLSEVGYVEGRNVTIDYRWAADQNERLPALAAELVRRKVALIYAQAPPSALAAKAATTTIPIVFTTGGDPVQSGLVASIGRPGGNITGATLFTTVLVAKRLELLLELVPKAVMIALLVNPTSANADPDTRELQAAAAKLRLQFRVLSAATERDIDTNFESFVQQRADGLVLSTDVFFTDRRNQIVALAARHAMPAIYYFREFATAGGLMSYGTRITDANHQAGIYAGRILKGEKPADLPIVQPTKFELVINLKTAKALGLDVPSHLQQLADELIE